MGVSQVHGMDFHGVWCYTVGNVHVCIYQNLETTFICNFIDFSVQKSNTTFVCLQSSGFMATLPYRNKY